jgi:hypothetical protein
VSSNSAWQRLTRSFRAKQANGDQPEWTSYSVSSPMQKPADPDLISCLEIELTEARIRKRFVL